MKFLLPFLLLLLGPPVVSLKLLAQTPTAQDCLGAIPICNDVITVPSPYPYSGNGNYLNEILGIQNCYTTESNGIWYTFTVQTTGLLRFTLSPADPNDDYDWILYDMTNTTCATLSTFSASAYMESSNNWGTFGVNGDVGISTANGGTGNCNGPGTLNGPKWNADLSVTAGNTYVLYVSNWSGSNFGFTLDFSASTAVLFDNVPPAMDTITSPIACSSFDSITVQFSENVLCNSVQTGDFALDGPNGSHIITGVSSPVCGSGADYSNEYTLYFMPSVTALGTYELTIKPGAGYVEDLCGNLDTIDTIRFDYNGAVGVSVSGTEPECNSYCTGVLDAQPIGGNPPYQYAWSGGLGTDSNVTNVCAGTYTVTITDTLGCVETETFVMGEPLPITIAVDDLTHITCYGSANCEGGAEISVSGGTPPYSYLWPSGEQVPTPAALCAGTNWVTVTDANNCVDSLSMDIQIPDSIQTFGNGDTMICIGGQASISAAAIGGTPPFGYVWTKDSLNGPMVSIDQALLVDPEVTTTYYVTVSDANNCAGDTSKVEVRVRPPLGLDIPVVDTICPYDTIDITVKGTGGDSAYSYSWDGLGFGPTKTVSPDQSRWYSITVGDVCGTPVYVDSVFVQVGGYSAIRTGLRTKDDSLCRGEETTLIANGRGGFRGPEEFTFQWSHVPESYPIQFVKPDKTTSYSVTISDRCLSEPGSDTITIYVGEKERPAVTVTPEEACAQTDVIFSIPNHKERYTYHWSMGDGYHFDDHQDDTVKYRYSTVGCYDVSLATWTDFGCYDHQVIPCAVEIFQKPIAKFTNTPSQPTNVRPVVLFENRSEMQSSHFWVVDGDTIEGAGQFSREFHESYEPVRVTLVAQSSDGCADTTFKAMDFLREMVLYYPGSFTPNGDGINEVFRIEGEEIGPKDFQLTIYDRWGNEVFLSTNPDYGWDGRIDNQPAPQGVYPFTLRYRDGLNKLQVIRDQVVISKTNARKTAQ